MRSIAVAMSALACATWMPSANAVQTQYFNKTIALLEVADSPCIYFQLDGVTEANPAVPNSPWFAIPKGQDNAKEMYALLLSVKLSGGSLPRVQTSGDIACGQAAKVLTIDL